MIENARTHFSHFQTAHITVRAPEAAPQRSWAYIAGILEATGGTTLFLEGCCGPVPECVGAYRVLSLSAGEVPDAARLAPIATEALAPGDVVLFEVSEGRAALYALRAIGPVD